MQQTSKVEETTTVEQQLTDALRAKCFAAMSKFYINVLLDSATLLPGMNSNVLKQTVAQLERFEREVYRTAPPHSKTYMDRAVREDKLLDMALIVDVIARIGSEEHRGTYEEFFGITMEMVDKIMYAQNNRKKLHFGKYKALFKLFVDEMKADVNKTPGQVLFTNQGELFLRTSTPQTPVEIK